MLYTVDAYLYAIFKTKPELFLYITGFNSEMFMFYVFKGYKCLSINILHAYYRLFGRASILTNYTSIPNPASHISTTESRDIYSSELR